MNLLQMAMGYDDKPKKLPTRQPMWMQNNTVPASTTATNPNTRDLDTKNYMSPVYQNLLSKDYETIKNSIIEDTPKENWNPETDLGYRALRAYNQITFPKSPLYDVFNKVIGNKYSFSDFVKNGSGNKMQPYDGFLLTNKNHYSDFNKAKVYTDFNPSVRSMAGEWDTIERALFALQNNDKIRNYLQTTFETTDNYPRIRAVKDLGIDDLGSYAPLGNTISLNNSNIGTHAHELTHALKVGRGYDWNGIPNDSLDIYKDKIVRDKSDNYDYYGNLNEIVAFGVANDFLKKYGIGDYLPSVYDENVMQQFINRLKKQNDNTR